MIEIIDNFLSDFDFRIIENQFLGPKIMWQFNPTTEYEFHSEKQPFQFVHGLYNNFSPQSEYFHYIKPFTKKLNVNAFFRVKVNLTTRLERIIEGDFHVDQFFDHKVAIFYLNTCDGYTLFENGEKVNSVENRIVLFNGSLKHKGTNCTDKQRRVVINFNYL